MAEIPDDYGENGLAEYGYGEAVTDGGDVTRQPFNDAPHTIPGRIPAAEFDHGGEGLAFHETSGRAGWAADFRSDLPVDIKASPDRTSEYAIGRFTAAEWLAYTIDLEPGTYELRARVATARDGRQLEVALDNSPIATLDVPNQGDWATYTTVSTEVTIDGDAREASLRLSPLQDGVDVAWVEFVSVDIPEPDPTPDRTTVEIAASGNAYQVVLVGTVASDVSTSVSEGEISTSADVTLEVGSDG